MTATTLHPRKQLLFALLSAADFTLTWWLLNRPDGGAYEANPIANWWLARFGWLGLAGFKTAVVLLVLGVIWVIARHRPRTAGGVLYLGCACLAAVVIYSAALGGAAAHASADIAADANSEYAESNRQTAVENARYAPFLALMVEVHGDIMAGRCTLREGAERLEGERDRCRPALLHGLACDFDGGDVAKLFACWAVNRAVDSAGTDHGRIHRLVEEFQDAYGPMPSRLRAKVASLRYRRTPNADPHASRAYRTRGRSTGEGDRRRRDLPEG